MHKIYKRTYSDFCPNLMDTTLALDIECSLYYVETDIYNFRKNKKVKIWIMNKLHHGITYNIKEYFISPNIFYSYGMFPKS